MELIVVTGIVILLAALILPNYRAGQRTFALQRAASKIAQDIRRAQEMAMASREFSGGMPPEGGYGAYFSMLEPYHYILFADVNANQNYDGSSEMVEDIEIESGITISDLPDSQTIIIFQPPGSQVVFNPPVQSVAITLGGSGERYYSLVGSVSGHPSPRASCDSNSSSQDCPTTFSAGTEDPNYVYDWYASGTAYQYQFQDEISGHPSPRASCDSSDTDRECPSSFSAQESGPEEVYDWYNVYDIFVFIRGDRVAGHVYPEQRAFCDFDQTVEDCTQGVCDCSQSASECYYTWPSGGQEAYNIYYDWCEDGGQPYSREYVGEGSLLDYSQRFVKTLVSGEDLSNKYQKISSGQSLKVEVYNTGLIKITK